MSRFKHWEKYHTNINSFKAGDFVRLTPKSVEVFYGTNKNAEMFMIGGIDFDKNTFCDYVGAIISFEDGRNAGLITGQRGSDNSWHVRYFDLLNNKWREHYFDENDLIKVLV